MTTLSPDTTTLTPALLGNEDLETLRQTPHPEVDVVIPVYNEEKDLAGSIRTLHAHLLQNTQFTSQITIADNASTDGTLDLARSLACELSGVRVLHLDRKGRGRALRAAWGTSYAEVVAYIDVDLSTDLAHLNELITPLLRGRGDIAIGSRLAPGSHVTRSLRRELISRIYNLILRTSLGAGFSDAQCGFKAGRRSVVQQLLPLIEDEQWFFDTELLYLTQREKLSIHEVPVHWVEDPDSSVDVIATAREDLRGVRRLRRSMRARPSRRTPRRRQARSGAPLDRQHA